MTAEPTPEGVLAFWFEGDPHTLREAWFRRSDAFDAAIRAHLGAAAGAAAEGALDAWAATPRGALALCVLLDQVPRNLQRGSAQAFAADPKARAVARAAVLRDRHDLALTPTERLFLYLPFEHSEAIADQDLNVALCEGLRDDPAHRAPGAAVEYAWRHWRVVRRFGRFPHRNAALGRETTPGERAHLAAHPAGF